MFSWKETYKNRDKFTPQNKTRLNRKFSLKTNLNHVTKEAESKSYQASKALIKNLKNRNLYRDALIFKKVKT